MPLDRLKIFAVMISGLLILSLWINFSLIFSSVDGAVSLDHLETEVNRLRKDRTVILRICNAAIAGAERKDIVLDGKNFDDDIFEKSVDLDAKTSLYGAGYGIQLHFFEERLVSISSFDE